MQTALSRDLSSGLLFSARQRTELFRTVLTSHLTARGRFFGCRKHAVKFSAPWLLLDLWATLQCPEMFLKMHLFSHCAGPAHLSSPSLPVYFQSGSQSPINQDVMPGSALHTTHSSDFCKRKSPILLPFPHSLLGSECFAMANGKAIFHSPFLLQIPWGRTYQSATPTAAKQQHYPSKPALPGIILLDKDHNKPIQLPPTCS